MPTLAKEPRQGIADGDYNKDSARRVRAEHHSVKSCVSLLAARVQTSFALVRSTVLEHVAEWVSTASHKSRIFFDHYYGNCEKCKPQSAVLLDITASVTVSKLVLDFPEKNLQKGRTTST